jgi:hypothetical protein
MLDTLPGMLRFWTPTGPSEEAVRFIEAESSPLSSGEWLLLRIAFDFWNGHGRVTIADVLATLDGERTRIVCDLMHAVTRGPVAVENWISSRCRYT